MDRVKRLPPMQEKFIKEYLVDLNAAAAAARAGYSEKTAKQQGCRLLTRDDIQAALQREMDRRAKRTGITADKVLQRWWDIATADPSEIVHLRRLCCRHCYGVGHEYQWRDKKEFDAALAGIEKQGDEPSITLSDAGGYGFDRLLSPSQACPYCRGEGHPQVYIADTRNLSRKGKALYAGIKETQVGVEVKFHDQGKALESVARHLGMFIDRTEVTGKDGGPIRTRNLSDEELDRKISQLMGRVMPDDAVSP